MGNTTVLHTNTECIIAMRHTHTIHDSAIYAADNTILTSVPTHAVTNQSASKLVINNYLGVLLTNKHY